MPLYEYQCDACGAAFEVIRKFADPPLTVCQKCGSGPVRKLVSSPAFQFKGSGWYITDYARKAEGAGTKGDGSDASTAEKTDAASKADKTEKTDKADRKDAASGNAKPTDVSKSAQPVSTPPASAASPAAGSKSADKDK